MLMVARLRRMAVGMPSKSPEIKVMSLAAIVSLALAARSGWTNSLAEWFKRWFAFIFLGWVSIIEDVVVLSRLQKKRGGRSADVSRWVLRWTLPLGMSLIFIMLFGLANPVIQGWLEAVGDWLDEVFILLKELPDPARVVFWIIIGCGFWTLHRFNYARLMRRKNGIIVATPSPAKPESTSLSLTRNEPMTPVQMIDAIANPEALVRCLV